jgi:hypothetical protein
MTTDFHPETVDATVASALAAANRRAACDGATRAAVQRAGRVRFGGVPNGVAVTAALPDPPAWLQAQAGRLL